MFTRLRANRRSRSKSNDDCLARTGADLAVSNCCHSERQLSAPVTALQAQLGLSRPTSSGQISRISSRWDRMESGEIFDEVTPRSCRNDTASNISVAGSILQNQHRHCCRTSDGCLTSEGP
ncbi:hypothetical protein Tcan_06663 [Toxocara canis]|uniref:Uncharacterized protein n=1 Tax=Toxocara canis TaxID=6265 RepID=A0A0B2URL6_TOXCA|nr:hypothetical protein Tcan_06663 [Toxocara canis]